MRERIVSRLLLKDRIPTYQQRAAYYRKRAIIDSFQAGILEHFLGETDGQELIDVVDTTSVTIPGQSAPLEFAFDRDGVAFARIEGGKYYKINTPDFSQGHLKRAKRYEDLSKSFLKRLTSENHERRHGDLFFDAVVSINSLMDSQVRFTIQLSRLAELLNQRGNQNRPQQRLKD